MLASYQGIKLSVLIGHYLIFFIFIYLFIFFTVFFITFLLNNFDWKVTMYVAGGLGLFCSILGALMRPLQVDDDKKDKQDMNVGMMAIHMSNTMLSSFLFQKFALS